MSAAVFVLAAVAAGTVTAVVAGLAVRASTRRRRAADRRDRAGFHRDWHADYMACLSCDLPPDEAGRYADREAYLRAQETELFARLEAEMGDHPAGSS